MRESYSSVILISISCYYPIRIQQYVLFNAQYWYITLSTNIETEILHNILSVCICMKCNSIIY